MTVYTNFANTDIPARVAAITGQRGFIGVNSDNINTARRLCRNFKNKYTAGSNAAAAAAENNCDGLM